MTKVNLIDSLFSKNHQFESALLCTYGLNLNFLENYLLKLDALYSCDNICIFTDSGTYDGFIKESYVPRFLNKKYLINRISSIGKFHTKLYMFASEKRALFGIGSANLTRDGIASNLELLSTFEVSENDTTYATLLGDCLEYTRRLADITKSKHAIEQIDIFNQICRPLLEYGDEENNIRFIHNIDRPLIEQIFEFLGDINVFKIQIFSPFFDSAFSPFWELKRQFKDCEFEIYIQQKKSTFPKENFSEISSQASLMLYKEIDRYIHGKAIIFHSEDSIILYLGSANFTNSGLILNPPIGNYEIGLIGYIDKTIAQNLLCLEEKKPIRVSIADEIEVSPKPEFKPGEGLIDYINEAVFKDNQIRVETNPKINKDIFDPQKFRILDFNNNKYEQNLEKTHVIKITPLIKKKVPGKLAVQFIGRNIKGERVKSNITWVIELEEKSRDPMRRRIRRVYNNPFDLISVLQEIIETGDEEELRIFLLKFDVPIDLVLPPKNYKRQIGAKSKGNIEGSLPKHRSYIFNAQIFEAYSECLNRLYNKLERHAENPQVNKINNFVMILSSFYSLIFFINSEAIVKTHEKVKIIDSDSWALVRDYYDMLMKHINRSWKLIWSKGGYKDSINAKLAKDTEKDEEIGLNSFEEYLSQEYNETFDELTRIVWQAIDNFEGLKKSLLVKTAYGKEIKPVVFPNNHPNLQPHSLNQLRGMISAKIIVRLNMMNLDDSIVQNGTSPY